MMASAVKEERVRELGESTYRVLKESYGGVRELKGLVDRLHACCLQGKAPDFDVVSAIKLTTDRLYEGLELYLRPECDPDSAYEEAMTEPEG
jgi:hypothetical protein